MQFYRGYLKKIFFPTLATLDCVLYLGKQKKALASKPEQNS